MGPPDLYAAIGRHGGVRGMRLSSVTGTPRRAAATIDFAYVLSPQMSDKTTMPLRGVPVMG